MAEHKNGVSAADVELLMVDLAGGTSYSTVVCIKTTGLDDTVAMIESKTACGNDVKAGDATSKITGNCEALFDEGSGKVSYIALRNAAVAQTKIGFKLAKATPVTGDPSTTGTGYISSIKKTSTRDAIDTFDIEITPIGVPVMVETA